MVQPQPTRAIYVRVPAALADKLDRVSERLGMSKRDIVATLVGNRLEVEDDLMPTKVWPAERPGSPEVLTIEEVAELLRVTPDDVRELAEHGELPARRIGEQWRFSRGAVLSWLDKR